jgi:hypothetical protein
MVTDTCNLSTWEAEAGRLRIWGQPGKQSVPGQLGLIAKTLPQKQNKKPNNNKKIEMIFLKSRKWEKWQYRVGKQKNAESE